jgi:hypothetical protein
VFILLSFFDWFELVFRQKAVGADLCVCPPRKKMCFIKQESTNSAIPTPQLGEMSVSCGWKTALCVRPAYIGESDRWKSRRVVKFI